MPKLRKGNAIFTKKQQQTIHQTYCCKVSRPSPRITGTLILIQRRSTRLTDGCKGSDRFKSATASKRSLPFSESKLVETLASADCSPDCPLGNCAAASSEAHRSGHTWRQDTRQMDKILHPYIVMPFQSSFSVGQKGFFPSS